MRTSPSPPAGAEGFAFAGLRDSAGAGVAARAAGGAAFGAGFIAGEAVAGAAGADAACGVGTGAEARRGLCNWSCRQTGRRIQRRGRRCGLQHAQSLRIAEIRHRHGGASHRDRCRRGLRFDGSLHDRRLFAELRDHIAHVRHGFERCRHRRGNGRCHWRRNNRRRNHGLGDHRCRRRRDWRGPGWRRHGHLRRNRHARALRHARGPAQDPPTQRDTHRGRQTAAPRHLPAKRSNPCAGENVSRPSSRWRETKKV